jgi:hypothetical protein
MDTIDELLEALRSDNPNGRRNRRLLLISVASMATALVIHHLTLGDVDTMAWQTGESPDWAGGSLLLVLLAPVVVYLAVRG